MNDVARVFQDLDSLRELVLRHLDKRSSKRTEIDVRFESLTGNIDAILEAWHKKHRDLQAQAVEREKTVKSLSDSIKALRVRLGVGGGASSSGVGSLSDAVVGQHAEQNKSLRRQVLHLRTLVRGQQGEIKQLKNERETERILKDVVDEQIEIPSSSRSNKNELQSSFSATSLLSTRMKNSYDPNPRMRNTHHAMSAPSQLNLLFYPSTTSPSKNTAPTITTSLLRRPGNKTSPTKPQQRLLEIEPALGKLKRMCGALVSSSSGPMPVDITALRKKHEAIHAKDKVCRVEFANKLKQLEQGFLTIQPNGLWEFDKSFARLNESFIVRLEALTRALAYAESQIKAKGSWIPSATTSKNTTSTSIAIETEINTALLAAAAVAREKYEKNAHLYEQVACREELKTEMRKMGTSWSFQLVSGASPSSSSLPRSGDAFYDRSRAFSSTSRWTDTYNDYQVGNPTRQSSTAASIFHFPAVAQDQEHQDINKLEKIKTRFWNLTEEIVHQLHRMQRQVRLAQDPIRWSGIAYAETIYLDLIHDLV
ncbi:unnamed protein product [Amoebophrya sp. A25]|nr:unnamed protein product [Amoebophrya sp. A25]|eukprot:GSA25T00007896001.1